MVMVQCTGTIEVKNTVDNGLMGFNMAMENTCGSLRETTMHRLMTRWSDCNYITSTVGTGTIGIEQNYYDVLHCFTVPNMQSLCWRVEEWSERRQWDLLLCKVSQIMLSCTSIKILFHICIISFV